MDAHRRQAIAQALQEGRQPRLGRAIGVVRLSTAITGDGADGDNAAFAPGFKVVGQVCQADGGGGEVRRQGLHHGASFAALRRWIAHVTENAYGQVELTGGSTYSRRQTRVKVEGQSIKIEQMDQTTCAQLQVGGDGLQALALPSGQHQIPPIFRQARGDGLSDGRSGTKNQGPSRLGGIRSGQAGRAHDSPRRSDCSERKRPCGSN